jgi:extracellular factor (EF) 3-hydroxypalmitic acid methyl ester biosynthesis protein
MRQEIEYLKALSDNGGPSENQYEELGALYKSINLKRKKGIVSEGEVMSVWQALPDVYCTTDTMQGYALMKPHGYSGDYVIIERIYQRKPGQLGSFLSFSGSSAGDYKPEKIFS